MSVNFISKEDLYNAPLTDFILPIVDIRSTHDYNNSHIPTAISGGNFASLGELYDNILNLGYENTKDIVLYDNNGQIDCGNEIVEHFSNEVKLNVYLLEGGFIGFSNLFGSIVDPIFDFSELILPAYIPIANIFLGSAMSCDIRILQSLNVKSIINAGAHEAITSALTGGFNYMIMDIADSSSQRLEPHLSNAIDFAMLHAREGPTFVHCSQGVSRSVSVVIAILMKNYGYSYAEAFQYVKNCRRVARPNDGFVRQLLEIDDALQRGSKRKEKNLEQIN